jgi:LuxR family maltose regulon positive regulatory protein
MSDSRAFDEALLTTKFFMPVASHAVIPRARLFTLLDEGLARPLTLVSAPAGFGKLTFVSAWARSKLPGEQEVAWVSLNEENNEQRRFWAYVLTALERCRPGTYQPFLTIL